MRLVFLGRRQWPRVSTPAALPSSLTSALPGAVTVRSLHGTATPFLPLPRRFPTGGRSSPPQLRSGSCVLPLGADSSRRSLWERQEIYEQELPATWVEGLDLVGSRGCKVDRGRDLVAEREKVASAFVP